MTNRYGTALLCFILGFIVARGVERVTPVAPDYDPTQLEAKADIAPSQQSVLQNQLAASTPSVAATLAATQPIDSAKQFVAAETGGPRPATAITRRRQHQAAEDLGSSFAQAREDAQHGLIAPLKDGGLVRDAKGAVVWNLAERATAKLDAPCPDTVHPALWRQVQLLGIGGLFNVCDRVYQVRGLDLANITFIEGDSGLIVVDPLLCAETARAALDLYYEHRPQRPVRHVIITHSHPDHFGGIYGIATKEQIAAGEVSVLAPKGFMEEVISESVLAGNAMQRRAGYMYGTLLPKGPTGNIGTGLGLGTPIGATSIARPTDSIGEPSETRVIDGLTFEFQLTPGSEAPAEMHMYIRELHALCTAENATQTMHNLYTLRGAKIRDAKSWAQYLQQSIDDFGDRVDVLFAPHHWPVRGQERVVEHLSQQRDLYKFIHDQTLRLANNGLGMIDCAESIKLPEELEAYWSNRGFYGCLNQNVKAVWNYYLGWFDGNPARLHPLPPKVAGTKYLEYMGGIEQVVARAREAFDQGDYRWVVQVLDHAISAEPQHPAARELMADALEQLGYQAECGPWRNFYLTGAKELRDGVLPTGAPAIESGEAIAAMPLSAIFDSMAIRLKSDRANEKCLTVNFQFSDIEESHRLTLSNGVLHHHGAQSSSQSDCSVQLSRSTFDEVLDGRCTLTRKVFEGHARIKGSPRKLQRMFLAIEQFEPWYDVVPSKTSSLNTTTLE